MMKRMFLSIMMVLALVVLPACGKRGPYNSKPVTTKPVPQVVAPKKPPVAVEPQPKTVRPQPMRPRFKPPRVAVVPKTEPAPVPKVEPKTEPVPVPKVEPKVEPKIEPKREPPVRPPCASQPKPVTAQVSIVDYWVVPYPSGASRELYGITFVVRNTAAKDMKVKVVCHYADGSLFGESMPNTVGANSEAKLMVRGFRRCADSCRESFNCQPEPVR